MQQSGDALGTRRGRVTLTRPNFYHVVGGATVTIIHSYRAYRSNQQAFRSDEKPEQLRRKLASLLYSLLRLEISTHPPNPLDHLRHLIVHLYWRAQHGAANTSLLKPKPHVLTMKLVGSLLKVDLHHDQGRLPHTLMTYELTLYILRQRLDAGTIQ
jgi:hypothetical protein